MYDPLRILLEESEHSQQDIGKWKPAAFRSYYPYHTTTNYLWISDTVVTTLVIYFAALAAFQF